MPRGEQEELWTQARPAKDHSTTATDWARVTLPSCKFKWSFDRRPGTRCPLLAAVGMKARSKAVGLARRSLAFNTPAPDESCVWTEEYKRNILDFMGIPSLIITVRETVSVAVTGSCSKFGASSENGLAQNK